MKTFISNLKALALGTFLAGASAVQAAQLDGDADEFGEFAVTITNWTQGPLGVGLATTMLLMGGAIGVAKNSPMPALTGIAGAAFLNWGPEIIQRIMLNGALV